MSDRSRGRTGSRGRLAEKHLLDPLEIAREVIGLEVSALQQVAERLGREFVEAVDLLASCKGKVVTSGVGKSGLVAKKIAATLTSTGTPSTFLHPLEALHGDAGILAAGDVALFVSHSGRGEEMEQLLPILKRLGVPLVAITGSKEAPVGRAADVVVETGDPPEGCPFGLVPTSSSTAALAVGDALAIAVLKRKGLTREDVAFVHPGGVIGRMKLRKVKDIMHSGDELPVVREDASMRETLLEIVAKKLGLAVVVNAAGVVTGIITDGDVKRILLRTGDFWSLRISEVMTRDPKCIDAEELVARAVQRMEENPSGPITSLVVKDSEGKPLGVVHLHDCLKSG